MKLVASPIKCLRPRQATVEDIISREPCHGPHLISIHSSNIIHRKLHGQWYSSRAVKASMNIPVIKKP